MHLAVGKQERLWAKTRLNQSVNKCLCQGIKHFSRPSHYFFFFVITAENCPFPSKKKNEHEYQVASQLKMMLVQNQKTLDYVG